MNDKQLNELLDRYFMGETSLAEEVQLHAFFRKEAIPAKWQPHQAVFRGLEQESEIQLPISVEMEIMAQIESEPSVGIRRIHWRPLLRYAAAVALLVMALAWWTTTLPPEETTAGIDWSQYEPDTPEEAAIIYQEALLKLSTALNDGASSAAKNVKRVKTVGQFFE